jgi:2-polyprenyl-6-methoxyphenol hydroxylase-like FAD-dependent oxidoreductase
MRTGELGFWWRSLGGPAPQRAPLRGPEEADVAIVGAGYTGLWTAYYLKRAEPSLRIVRPRHKFKLRGISNTLSYSISQRQNPGLTINSSADPIAHGQSIQLTGTLAGGASQPVTLLARTPGGGWATIEKGTTDAAGGYSFTQSPPQSTFYRVTGPNVHSTVLFEGVSYVLTASVSATTVHSGQPLTFAGAVTPARAGHVV